MRTTKLTTQRLTLTPEDVKELEGNFLAIPINRKAQIIQALTTITDVLEKYEKLVLVYTPSKRFTPQLLKGFLHYCCSYNRNHAVIERAAGEIPTPGTAYFTLYDTDTAALLQMSKVLDYTLGQEMGILSLEDNLLKKMLGLTVLTTDFEAWPSPHSPLRQNISVLNTMSHVKIIRRQSL